MATSLDRAELHGNVSEFRESLMCVGRSGLSGTLRGITPVAPSMSATRTQTKTTN